ncbi:MAG TPA: N-acetylmuramoyl-L-alanine amidase [Longimicrobiaceae bacterium]|nr:N-acetylmuramoyl-L-alanine amidase [Longimicrobiaceae bacterium]
MRTRFPELRLLLLTATALLLSALPAVAQGSAPKRLVVVDAGHGGVDPGAHGPSGTQEKSVTLAVAKKLAAILRDEPDLEVRMTRTRDTLIALHDRPRMANGWRQEGGRSRPALFISIHANANRDRSAHGFETFFLSEAKTEDARRVAKMENAAQQYETESEPASDALSFILNDLRQNHYLRASDRWAEVIQDRLAETEPGPDRGVKQAGFVVLNGAFMPAVLVEIGFITNPREERFLTDPDSQRQIARQLARAILDFFDDPSFTADGV